MLNMLPDELIMCVWRSLLGEIYPQIRAIALKYNLDNKTLLIRYYLDRKPIEMDYESISVLETNIFSGMGPDYIVHSNVECVYSELIIGSLDSLDGFVYVRREYFD